MNERFVNEGFGSAGFVSEEVVNDSSTICLHGSVTPDAGKNKTNYFLLKKLKHANLRRRSKRSSWTRRLLKSD